MKKIRNPRSGIINVRILTATALCSLGASLGFFGFASTPPSSSITVPATVGQTVSVTWTGTVPPLANPTSDCANLADTPAVDQHLPTISVPAGVYNNVNAKFTFTITWDGDGNDEILTVLNPDGSELSSSDNSNPPNGEMVTANNLAGGTYKVVVCGFVSGPAGQPYTGKLTIDTSSTSSLLPPPTPTPAPPAPGVPRFQEYTPTDANGAPSSSLGLIAGEPTMFVRPQSGSVFYQGLFEVLRLTFNDSTSPAKVLWEFKDPPTGASNKVTLDPILTGDPVTGRIWAMQLTAGVSATDYRTDDGDTWSPAFSGFPGSGVDHEGMGVGPYPANAVIVPPATYQNAVYYCSQDVATAFCSRSDTGGQTYGPIVPIYDSVTSKCVGLHGHPKVAPDGTVYVPNKGCGLDTPVIGNGLVNVVVSEDAGVNWNIRAVPDSTGSLSSKGDPSVGIATDGTIYLAYQDLNTNHMKVAVSHNKGVNFSPSVDVGAAEGINYSVFPAAVAGDPDRAAVAFFGSTYNGSNTDFTDMSFPGFWYLYVATTFDGGNTWHTANATPDNPIQGFGGIGNSGDNRNHYDFIDAAIDTQGRVLATNSIGCSAACAKNGTPDTLSKLAGVVRQSGGQRMYHQFDPVEPAPPAAPLLNGYRTGQLISVNWPEPDGRGVPITGYNVYRSVNGGAETKMFSAIAKRNFTELTDPANSYSYRVTAVSSQGEGGFSNAFAPTIGQNAPRPELSCSLPGQVYTDRTGEGGAQPSNDIASFSIAEPSDMPGKLVFVINNAQPNLVQAGNSIFYVFFDPLSGGIRYRLRYSADSSAPLNEIGTGRDFDFTNDTTPEVGGEFRNWTIISTLDAGSGIQSDGSVRFIVDKAALGINTGDVLLGVAVREDTAHDPSSVILSDYAGGRQDYAVVGNDFCTRSLVPTSVVSRKVHGTAGTFDVNLPLTGARGVEPRTAGNLPNGATGDYQVVFNFPVQLSSVTGATVSAHDPSNATGSVQSSMIDPNNPYSYIVNLSNVSNVQYLTVTLNGVNGIGDVVGPQWGLLVGDVNANGALTNADVSAVKAQVAGGGAVSGSNFRTDVNANGGITNADVSLTKAQVAAGAQLPSPP